MSQLLFEIVDPVKVPNNTLTSLISSKGILTYVCLTFNILRGDYEQLFMQFFSWSKETATGARIGR